MLIQLSKVQVGNIAGFPSQLSNLDKSCSSKHVGRGHVSRRFKVDSSWSKLQEIWSKERQQRWCFFGTKLLKRNHSEWPKSQLEISFNGLRIEELNLIHVKSTVLSVFVPCPTPTSRWDAQTSLDNPAIPAPPSRWPTLVFTAPRRSAWDRSFRTERNAPVSMGSPNSVPVPCVSTWFNSCGLILASWSAIRTTNSCEGPLGEVRLALRPSWFRALPMKDANVWWSLLKCLGCNTWAPHPSPRA